MKKISLFGIYVLIAVVVLVGLTARVKLYGWGPSPAALALGNRTLPSPGYPPDTGPSNRLLARRTPDR